MYYHQLVFIFLSVILAHNSAAAMKRSHEGNQESKPKRIKLLQRKEKVDLNTSPKRLSGFYYCSKSDDCTYTTRVARKINEHHQLHEDSNAIPCTKCDYLGSSNRAVINHSSKWHRASRPENHVVVQTGIQKEKCGYCGIEGDNLQRHKQVYHTPGFGRRSYHTSFPLNK